MKILVTGGAGYIGSHTVVELCQADNEVEIVDDFSNSSEAVMPRLEQLTGKSIPCHRVDLLDRHTVSELFKDSNFDAVIHFAGLKAVGESVAEPLRYYHTNITGTLNLLAAMEAGGCQAIVFSSSATVYGDPASLPITEDFSIQPTNPYGQTKAMIEQILTDTAATGDRWRIALLRYFNPAGAHPSGEIGENPLGRPNNLLPFIAQLAVGRQPELLIYGDDYPTSDGTGVRDYIHVMDLAAGHASALSYLEKKPGLSTFNLGTGRGYSVKEVLHACEAACEKRLPARVVPRRPGDIASCYADPSKAQKQLGWGAKLDLAAMCRDIWNWQSKNPTGYPE